MASVEVSTNLSPDPMLSAVEDYRGTIVDLDRDLVVRPAMLASARKRLAREMADAGLHPGDRVVLAVGNGPQFIAAWAAVLMRGGSPLLVHADTPASELRRIAERFHARLVASDGAAEAELRAATTSLETLSADSWSRLMWGDFGEAAETTDQTLLHLPGVPLHPTSGTTAQPRVAVRPVVTAIAEAEHYVRTIGVDRSDRLLSMAPMSHAFGHGWYVITPMVTGADVLTMRRFNPALVFRAYQEHSITMVPAVAAMLAVLMFGAGDRLYGTHRRVITGGAPLPDRTALNFERISGTRVRPLYGTTEAGGIAVARADDPRATRGRVGQPFEGVSVEIRPPADAASLGDGRGLVHVRSASVMIGYLNDETIDTSMLPDGWFNTGDLGWVDDDGALHLCGRQAEVINVSGMKVLPSEVEEVISSMAGVAEVKVYSGKTRHGSHHIKAAVVVDEGIDVAAIKTHCEKHLVYYKRPSRITIMDALPRSSGGKIVYDQLP